MKSTKRKIKPELIVSCLDVLCRANAVVANTDPKLAYDISKVIESLVSAINADPPDEDILSQTPYQAPYQAPYQPPYQEDEIVDVLHLGQFCDNQG